METEKIIKAGEIAKEVKEFAKEIIKKDMPLLEIAEKIEDKIKELGGKPAFPTNLSINEIAAHYTPSHNDETLAHGLLKIDFGAHVDGWCSDTAFSLDLENSKENEKLIEVSKKALEKAQEKISIGINTSEVGEEIQKEIEAQGFLPIINLSGHEIGEYDLHAGLTIPNFNDNSNYKIEEGLYAIEPFATLSSGNGKVKDGKPSGIYQLMEVKNIRSELAREVLDFIIEEYDELPFCSRWLVKEFGTKAILALKQLEQNGNLHHFAQLVESSGTKVAQSENTILLTKEKKIVTTE